MKILVAGGAGYIGSRLVPVLLEHGYEVEVIDLLWFGNHLPSEVKVIKKDLFCCREQDLGGYDQVIFLAGISNDPMAEYNPAKNFIGNGALPSYVAYLAKKAGVKRFIYASSCSVYGYSVDRLYDEEAPAISAYPYGISKLQGERGVLQLQDPNFSVIALRQGTVCGHSPRMRFDLIVNAMLKSAVMRQRISVSNPAIWRPILDIRDATAAYLRAIEAPPEIGGVFNIASDNYTVSQTADLVKIEVERVLGKKITIEIHSQDDMRNYKVLLTKAKTYLGFTPIYSVAHIVDELFEHLADYGDLEQDKYYNIRIFKKIDDGSLPY